MRVRTIWGLSLAIIWFSLAASPAQAHKLLVSATPQVDGALTVQAFFPDGHPAQEIPVALIPEDGRPPWSGKTDAQGTCRFAALPPGQYRVEVGDPLGHRAETRVVIPGAGVPSPGPQATLPVAATAKPEAAVPPGEPIPWGNILAGLGFIFGLTAFLMALKLRREGRRNAP